jgi:predicted metalloendopeptidase
MRRIRSARSGVADMPAFVQAFPCKAGDAMHRDAKDVIGIR